MWVSGASTRCSCSASCCCSFLRVVYGFQLRRAVLRGWRCSCSWPVSSEPIPLPHSRPGPASGLVGIRTPAGSTTDLLRRPRVAHSGLHPGEMERDGDIKELLAELRRDAGGSG